jgi:hypothetical protein
VQKKKIATVAGAAAGLVALSAGVAAASAPATAQGPSSSKAPVILPLQPGVSLTSILTTGDAVNGYRLAGIPDGLGAFDNGDGTFTLLVNHEINATLGVARAHQAKGAFISKHVIDKSSLTVLSSEDEIKQVFAWDGAAWKKTVTAFGRFCSGDLAPVSAFYDEETRKGTKARIYLNGEEIGDAGRALAHVVTGSDAGSSYILPWLGTSSWENWVAKPNSGEKTVLVGTDDSTPGQVYVYVGTKQRTGNDVERAGLTNGTLYGVVIDGIGAGSGVGGKETDATTVPVGGANFSLVELGDGATIGSGLQALSVKNNISELARPEDASWDPSNRRNLYVATTNSFAGRSRLWKLTFDDPRNVLLGGKAEIAIDGPAKDATISDAAQPGPRMFDNITVNKRGQVIALEDVGNSDYLGGVYLFDPKTKGLTRIAQHDPAQFTPGAADFITKDEESSGVIPAPFLGEDTYLLTSQIHVATDAETVESGQLLALRLDDDLEHGAH